MFSPLASRCENYTISLLEQCENLEEVETLLQTKRTDHQTHKDANYFMAILGKGASTATLGYRGSLRQSCPTNCCGSTSLDST